jgi:hypothetical protein
MRKTFLVLAAISCSLATTFVSAAYSDGYYTSQQQPHLAMTTALAAVPAAKATDIRITNGSNNIIHITVPNAVKMDVNSGTSEHIYHDTRAIDTEIVLQGPNGNTIYDALVCRYALITVYGNSPSSYGIDVNKTYCN